MINNIEWVGGCGKQLTTTTTKPSSSLSLPEYNMVAHQRSSFHLVEDAIDLDAQMME